VNRPRVALAEDHAQVAEQLRKLLTPEFDIVATVADGRALVQAVEAARPDVVVTDIMMPGLESIAATAALRARRPDARVALVTVHDDRELAERGYAAGALGYVVGEVAATESMLNKSIGELRIALGDSFRAPRVVESAATQPT